MVDINTMPANRHNFVKGVKSGVPIGIGFLPIAITFGLLGKGAGMSTWETCFMSLIVFAGASQFVGVNLMTMGATTMEIVLTTFILNFRHFIMTSALSRRFEKNVPSIVKAAMAFGITDETFTVAALEESPKLKPSFIFGLNLTAYSAWNIGTFIGAAAAAALPASIQASMGIALYSMFVGLLIPTVRKNKAALLVALVAMVVNCFFKWLPSLQGLNGGWGIVISTAIAAMVGTLIFPKADEVSYDE